MKPTHIIAVFKVLTTIGFYFLVITTVVFMFFSLINAAGNKSINTSPLKNNNYKVISFSDNKGTTAIKYSDNKQLSYQLLQNEYYVQINPSSPFGYYTMLLNFVYLLLGIFTLQTFRKILKEIQLEAPFTGKIVRLLKSVAAVFILADFIKVINYIIFNQYLHQQMPTLGFKLQSEIGSGFIIGAITWIVVAIYQRGVELQTENNLTV
jgi:magnesium-transporting ATPase (P-type)